MKLKEGCVGRYKTRLVVDGSKQVFGIDYMDNIAPVVKLITAKTFLVISTSTLMPHPHPYAAGFCVGIFIS